MANNTLLHPSRLLEYDPNKKHYPRELTEKDGILYFIDEDGNATEFKSIDLKSTTLKDESGATIGEIIPDVEAEIVIESSTTSANGLMSSADKTKLDGIATGANNYTLPSATADTLGGVKIGSNITNTDGVLSISESNITDALGFNPISESIIGVPNGIAELDDSGKIPSSQLPSYVDDVIEGTLETFPAVGESGKVYLDIETNISYRWSGSTYTFIGSPLSLGETSSSAYRGDRGKTAYDHSQAEHAPVSAEENQNAFSNIDVDGSAISSTSKTDTFEIESGDNVSIAVSGKKINISSTDTTYSSATTSSDGLMAAADKTKLDGIATGANNYVHPTTAGNKHIPSGGSTGQILKYSASGTAVWAAEKSYASMTGATASAAGATGLVPAPAAGKQTSFLRGDGTWAIPSNTEYSIATTLANGLMSSTDKTKLDGIATGANNYVHPTTAGNKHIPSGGSTGQILKYSEDGTAIWGSAAVSSDAQSIKGYPVLEPNSEINAPTNVMFDGTNFYVKPSYNLYPEAKNDFVYLSGQTGGSMTYDDTNMTFKLTSTTNTTTMLWTTNGGLSISSLSRLGYKTMKITVWVSGITSSVSTGYLYMATSKSISSPVLTIGGAADADGEMSIERTAEVSISNYTGNEYYFILGINGNTHSTGSITASIMFS